MFTVVIAEKKHIDAIKNKNSLFFQNFINNKELAFCEWNTEGQTFKESVPDLVSIVGRHELWKAVIINPECDKQEETVVYSEVNPFDIADMKKIIEYNGIKKELERNSDSSFFEKNESLEKELKKNWHDYYDGLLQLRKESYENISKRPLQRLATYLCFKKDMYYDYSGKNNLKNEENEDNDVNQAQNNKWIKKDEIHEWLTLEYNLYDKRINALSLNNDEKETEEATLVKKMDLLKKAMDKLRFDQLSVEEYLETKEEFEDLNQTRNRLQEQFNRDVIILKEELHRQMTKGEETINIYLPSEVYCVAGRTTESTFFNPDLAWENRFSIDYSDFAERNLLFDKIKFLVFDVLPETHNGYRSDYIRFLYAILLIASYEVPTGIISSRKLYKINSDNSEKPLCEMATAYNKKLEQTYELIDKEIEKIYDESPGMFSDTEAENKFSKDKAVDCKFENDFKESDLFINRKKYVSLCNWNDKAAQTWPIDYKISEKVFKKLTKQPCRAIKKGVDVMKELSDTSVAEAERLTKFQIDDLREVTENRENDMVNMDIPNLFNFTPYQKRINEKDKKIRKIIAGTMSKTTAWALGGTCVGMFFLCFLPFIFNNNNNIESVFMSVIFAITFLGIVAAILFVSLYFLHKPLREAIFDYNSEMKSVLEEIKTATGKIGNYLTKMAGVRRGNKIIKYTENSVASFSNDILIRQKHQADILKQQAYLIEEYGEYIDDDMAIDSLDISPYVYNFSKNKLYEYPAPYPHGNYKSMEFMLAGNRIPVPTEFAIRLYLTMEEIYD